jgi:hypothetical protein
MKKPGIDRSRWLIDSVHTSLQGCSLYPSESGVRAAIACLKETGVRFFDVAGMARLEDPSSRADSNGNIILPIQAGHDLLFPTWDGIVGSSLPSSPHMGGGLASFGYLEEGCCFIFSQSSYYDGDFKNDQLADGQLQLVRMLYPSLHPAYGWIDERSAHMPRVADVHVHRLKYIFWANIFGPAYVQFLGRSFLLATPDARVEEMDDGGILCVARESYVDWWKNEPSVMVRHFQSKVPTVQLYRAETNYN